MQTGPPAPAGQAVRRECRRVASPQIKGTAKRRAAWPHHDPSAGRPEFRQPLAPKIGLGLEGGRQKLQYHTPHQRWCQRPGPGPPPDIQRCPGRPSAGGGRESGACCPFSSGPDPQSCRFSWRDQHAGATCSSDHARGRARPDIAKGGCARANVAQSPATASQLHCKNNSTLLDPTRDADAPALYKPGGQIPGSQSNDAPRPPRQHGEAPGSNRKPVRFFNT